MPIDAILGLQWGDEGKGKIVDYLADQYQAVCRFQGGPNAGHTLYRHGKKIVLHTLPSGIFRKNVINVIGNGVVLDPLTLEKEINQIESMVNDVHDRLIIAKKAHLIVPSHRWIDIASENFKGKMKIGSTLRGIGPCYMDKTGRNGLRIGDIHGKDFESKYKSLKEKHLQFLKQFPDVDFDIDKQEESWLKSIEYIRKIKSINAEYYLNDLLKKSVNLLAEGAQGTMLDVDFGTYPYVTSSNTISAGISTGLGTPPREIRKIIGIAKAYCTRVGSGPFPSELINDTGEKLRMEGSEFGSTTGRPRRCGWLDAIQLNYSIMINGVNEICLTKIDVLNTFEDIEVTTQYQLNDGTLVNEIPYNMEDISSDITSSFKGWMCSLEGFTTRNALPSSALHYIRFIENFCKVPIPYISTGPGRDQLIVD